mgnify:CR=1 FL=1
MIKRPTTFSIKDLENLSGIKAHTIRIWEKRYNILSPERTSTNIRMYNLQNLQKLLNITFLYNSGYKISKLGNLTNNQIKDYVKSLVVKKATKDYFLDELKLSMLTFDQFKFETTYNKLLSEMSFSEMFLEIFIPLLDYIGLQWLSDSITPSHEHFITSLIMQKLLINIERVNITRPEKKNIYVLFLPENEIHELGLLYANYVLLKEGYQTIYLGPSVPIDSLESIISCYSNVSFVSYFTVAPTKLEVNTYLEEMNHKILSKYKLNLNILGRNAQEATFKSPYLKVFNKIDNLLNKTIL